MSVREAGREALIEPAPELPVLSVLGEPRCYRAGEAAAAAGISLTRARRYWRALGYPTVADTVVEYTATDIEILRFMARYVADGVVDEPESLRLIRVISSCIASLVQVQMEIVADRSERPGGVDVPLAELANRVPEIQQLFGQIWRRQLDGVMYGRDPAGAGADRAATGVGFVDIVGFTELSRHRSDVELSRIVARFEYRTTAVVAECGGAVVKTLGDEVLFTAEGAAPLADIATRLLAGFADDPDIGGLRVGLALGPVVRQLGDIFGNTVNLASRLTRLATPNTIVVDPAVAGALTEHLNFGLVSLPAAEIRGIGTVVPALLRRR
ncbi:adenylate/guanylate cyclase domain-containing protein [Nocardia halotolerans]|uniref:Adenylate/guanylate cyclase domain-containing protein n=1 Tax=Nocardia halotolerans TaxID=1755878 RepID=A0ABV8VMT4_9NOCA